MRYREAELRQRRKVPVLYTLQGESIRCGFYDPDQESRDSARFERHFDCIYGQMLEPMPPTLLHQLDALHIERNHVNDVHQLQVGYKEIASRLQTFPTDLEKQMQELKDIVCPPKKEDGIVIQVGRKRSSSRSEDRSSSPSTKRSR